MMSLGPGAWLGRYELVAELGRGGMGAVFRARDRELDRQVAIKVLSPLLAGDPGFVERFRREARLVAGLRHPNIVVLHDWGSQNGVPYLVMELLDGISLKDRVRQSGRLPLPTVLTIFHQCADALDYAHGRGVIHRDVKPGNVMVDGTDHATLTDFGIARTLSGSDLTVAGGIVGTPEYLSPEQAIGQPVDGRSDVYSLGVMVYELLAGRVPFQADSTPAILHLHAYAAPPALATVRPELPGSLGAVLARALAKNPQDRFATAGEFCRDFEAALGQSGAPWTRPPAQVEPSMGASSAAPPATPWPVQAAPTGPEGGAARSGNRWWRTALLGLAGLAIVAVGALVVPPALAPREAAAPTATRVVPPTTVAAAAQVTAAPTPQSRPPTPLPSPAVLVAAPPSPSPVPTVDPVVALVREGDALREDLNAAVAKYRQALARDPDNSLGRRQLGIALSWQIQPEAVAQLEEAVRLNPRDAVALGYLSTVYLDHAQYDRAGLTAAQATQTDPNAAEANAALAAQRLAANDVKSARTAADQALRANPSSEIAQWASFQASLEEDDLDGALTQARKMIAQHPRWAMPHRYLARVYRDQEKPDLARKELEEAQKVDPNTIGTASGLGWILVDEKNFDEAERAFQSDLERNDRYSDAMVGVGWVKFNQKDFPTALSMFRRATEVDPRSSQAYDAVGWTLTETQEKHLEAEANFRKALEIYPRNHDAICGLGVTLYHRGQYEAALTSFQDALKLAPRNPYYHLWAGAALFALNRLPEARSELERADFLKPNDPTIRTELDRIRAAGG